MITSKNIRNRAEQKNAQVIRDMMTRMALAYSPTNILREVQKCSGNWETCSCDECKFEQWASFYESGEYLDSIWESEEGF